MELAGLYLENARRTTDHGTVLLLCHDTNSALSHVKRAAESAPKYAYDHDLRLGIAEAYLELGKLHDDLGQAEGAQASYKIAEEFGYAIDG